MKPWIKTAAVFLLGFLVGIAAAGVTVRQCFLHGPSNDPRVVLQRLSSKLNLTEDQKPKVEALIKQEMPKGEALRQETRDKFKALKNSFDAQLRPLLSPDQQKKLDRMNARWQKGRNGGHFFGCSGPGPGGAPPPASAVTGK